MSDSSPLVDPVVTKPVVKSLPAKPTVSETLLLDVVAFLHWAFPGHEKLPRLPAEGKD